MPKFQRAYILDVECNDGSVVEIADPITLIFSINRNILASANTGSFLIYNLSQETRNKIFHDVYDVQHPRQITLRAGYENKALPIVFKGNIKQAQSYREEGGVDVITEIEGYDLSFPMVNSFSNFNLAPPAVPIVTRQMVIERLVKDLYVLQDGRRVSIPVGAISQFPGEKSRGFVAMGPTWEILQTESERQCFIDNGRVYVLNDNDVFENSDIIELTSENGLLSTPKKCDSNLTVEILFEPRLQVGQIIDLQESLSVMWNGTYRVIGVQHRGTISGAVAGKCKTLVNLYLPPEKLQIIDSRVAV